MSMAENIDLSVGARLIRKKGASVGRGEAVLEVLYSSEEKLAEALPFFSSAFSFDREGAVAAADERSIILGKVS